MGIVHKMSLLKAQAGISWAIKEMTYKDSSSQTR